jgi:transposase
LKRAAAGGACDLFYLDQCGVAPTLPVSYTWARVGTRPLVRYEAPQRRRVNVLGALAPGGPRTRLLFESRLAAAGKLDSAVFLDFVCRELAGLPGGRAALPALPAGARRARPCVVVLDIYGVHHSRAVKAARPRLAAFGVTLYYLPPYSPELNRIEAEWRAMKYTRLRARTYTSGTALQDAVDQALRERDAELRHATNHFPGAA